MSFQLKLFSVLVALLLWSGAFAQYDRAIEFSQDISAFIPLAADVLLSFTGVDSNQGFVDRGIEASIAFAAEVLVVPVVLKNLVSERRPDGTDCSSFPSGHTASAFLGAELIRSEYGCAWGAAAYGYAGAVAVGRVVHERHHWWDAVAGAGIGFACARLGMALREPVKSFLGIETKGDWFAVIPVVDPGSGALCATFAMKF